jgi:hypothetical protein
VQDSAAFIENKNSNRSIPVSVELLGDIVRMTPSRAVVREILDYLCGIEDRAQGKRIIRHGRLLPNVFRNADRSRVFRRVSDPRRVRF